MAYRQIKDSILSSPNFTLCSLCAQMTFIKLLVTADNRGALPGDITTVRGMCFSHEGTSEEEIGKYLRELEDNELIIRYTCGGREYIIIKTFVKNQYKNYRLRFKYPVPDDILERCGIDPSIFKKHTNDDIAVRDVLGDTPQEQESLKPEKKPERTNRARPSVFSDGPG